MGAGPAHWRGKSQVSASILGACLFEREVPLLDSSGVRGRLAPHCAPRLFSAIAGGFPVHHSRHQ